MKLGENTLKKLIPKIAPSTQPKTIAIPVVGCEGNEDFIVITVKVPTGANKGTEPYDGYELHEEYLMKMKDKEQKEKEREEKKKKKIERDKQIREKKKEIAEKGAE